ncbi:MULTISPECIES: ATP-dependent DNA helicase [unclassified Modestobacter]|uniref:ATP-dependent DNA helicase n=1 Tax=unclassified Modestobacter TaxID=2643866 RepID=UPI0022AA2B6E|nr:MULTISPECIES: ATP-dependent DNA helicase [unclassified Modestobacter]MCZ2823858.1 ATP-dependent DNA helicase [Modestobacter sp. VKM Ac-2981]MCZ2852103.1 ATP-dependent DNA helicase [Modestobacter sp. VKM Ac-2982]
MTPRTAASDGQLSFDLPGMVPVVAPEPPRLLTPSETAVRSGVGHSPSPEQAGVVAAPVDRPLVVVAGAGSGKTETMAARVAWLVANQLVAPEAVLGLTFTRKAASELNARVRKRLGALAEHPDTDPGLRERLAVAAPTVATYHGYAASIVAEHGLRIGVEPGSGVLGPAMCWGQAATAVAAHTGDMSDVALGLVTTTEDVLQLAAELGEHDITPDALRAWTARFESQLRGYADAGRKKGPYAEVLKLVARQRARVALLPMVEAFQARKRAAGAIDYADQVSLAARVAVSSAEVGRRERARWRVVLLDEYQDTSVGQLRMLEALFGGPGGHPVLAVGDPRQSIYGWRGASAGTIERFARTFPGTPERPAERLTLSTSWRNDRAVLAVANTVAAALPEPEQPLPDLQSSPVAGGGAVRCGLYETVAEETEALADRLEQCWKGTAPATGRGDGDTDGGRVPRPTIAVLARRRAQLPGIAAALRARGLPVEVVGLGGLLDVPEVSDVVATLRVLVDPSAGDALGRLLTGARWRIGPRDLAALEARSRALVRERRSPSPEPVEDGTPPQAGAPASPVLPRERGSIVEALDDLGRPEAYSAEGHRRLRRLANELSGLRSRLGESLPDLVDEVVRSLGLETELASHPDVTPGGARAHLDALHEVAAEFSELAELPSLPAFLGYLADAEVRERGLEPGEVAVNPEAVQLLTGHSAKGLEWDVVAVPGMTVGQFPAKGDASDSWIRDPGAVPVDLRATDRAELPRLHLPVPGSGDQAAVRDALEDYVEEWKDFGLAEEIRLGYVAVTRAKHLLLCSGSWWRDGKTVCGPSSLLLAVKGACEDGAGVVDAWAEPPADDAENPALAEWPVGVWPADPLSAGRRRSLTAAADLVAATQPHPLTTEALGATDDPLVADWLRDADLLLRERAEHSRGTVDVPLPTHLSVSALVALRRDPGELARRLRRPMPAAPAPLARRGTAFHAWLEERFGAARLIDLDELPGSGDAGAAPDAALTALQQAFLAGEWADRQPVDVEAPFETPLGPLTLRGRIDAVYATPDGGYEVIDWKTGPVPGAAELAAAAVQLAAYRLGWSRLTAVPVERVSAGFHHVAAGVTLRPADLLDEAGLLALVTGGPAG